MLSRVSILLLLVALSSRAAPLDFNLDVRPILSDRCFRCHGFDAKAREADLRLDDRDGAIAARENGQAIVPGDPDRSLVWQRITATDPDDMMPPPDSHLSLNAAEKQLLRQWIAEGAKYDRHWALNPVTRPDPPEAGRFWRNPIDRFVAARLERDSLEQSPEATRHALIRRLSLDLRGLPPTPREVEQFLADQSPDAYGKLVERFLADPAYGERMAWPWLDAARYADSNGYQGDRERTMWPWRDWVVDAFNRNLPWDQLTIWQLAGDLLPDATEEQILATAFLRNHPINGEGGRIAEENRVDYVMDMTETTGTVWLGLTFNCARCHDHKYDPITQEEYYRLSAFFNQTPVNGGGGDPQTPPVLTVASGDLKKRDSELKRELVAAEKALAEFEETLREAQPAWEASQKRDAPDSSWEPLKIHSLKADKQKLETLDDGSILAGGDNPNNDAYRITGETALATVGSLRLEAIRHESMTAGGLARSDSGNFVLTDLQLRIQPLGADQAEPLRIAGAEATYEQGSHKITNAFNGDPRTGWAVHEGRMVDRDHEAVFRFEKPAAVPPNSTIVITLRHDSPHQHHNLGRFRLSLSADPQAGLGSRDAALHAALSTPAEERTREQSGLLTSAHRESVPRHAELRKVAEEKRKALGEHRKRFPKVMVMRDMDKPRKTHILEVGLYDKPGAEVEAGTPASLPPFPEGAPRNRLGLARWLVSPDNPLTSRVTVNRFWQEFFGTGLIKTPENFGVQSEVPIHPRLLDWLAAEFMDSGWDVKHLVRTIVTSHTYRQTSHVTPELLEADPANRLLSRGPRFRMPAWMIRDQALAASGLLVARRGGTPVNSYQPDGIWAEATFGKKRYSRGVGDDLYRRSMYSFWRRIAAPPMFFDNPGRETCSVKTGRTNTPLHALSTLNDTTYVEAARALAARAEKEAFQGTTARLERAFQLILARKPNRQELAILEDSFDRALVRFTGDPKAAADFLANGESPRNSELPEAEHAALAAVCLGIPEPG